jgi:hypothetical protein
MFILQVASGAQDAGRLRTLLEQMIFTTWNFGPERVTVVNQGCTSFRSYNQAEQGRAAARQYAADIFNVCAAKRDYGYADHPWPAIPGPLHPCAAVDILQNVVREFNRSNPGHEIRPTIGC